MSQAMIRSIVHLRWSEGLGYLREQAMGALCQLRKSTVRSLTADERTIARSFLQETHGVATLQARRQPQIGTLFGTPVWYTTACYISLCYYSTYTGRHRIRTCDFHRVRMAL